MCLEEEKEAVEYTYIYTRLLNRVLPPGCVWYVCDKGEEGFGWRARGFLACI